MAVRRWVGGLALLLVALTRAGAGTPLEDRVQSVLRTPPYQHAHWGLLVVDAKTGATVFERHPDELFCPASVTKLFTTAAAIADLGADFRFRTPLVRRGEVQPDGTLDGDLILVASGDLSFGGRTGPDGTLLFEDHDHTYAAANLKSRIVAGDPLAGLDVLARAVRDRGIRAVRGAVLVDDRIFERAPSSGSGPARVSPILVNDNLVDVVVTPGTSAGDPAQVRTVPETSFITCDAAVETVEAGGRTSIRVHPVGPGRFTVRGRIAAGREPVIKYYEVEDPASFARALLIETLRRRGIRVAASPLDENEPARLPPREAVASLPKVAEYTSPPLRESVRVILKVSHNLHASTLPLIVASRHGERTLAEAMAREGRTLRDLGLDPKAVSFGGGAGGSRADLVTPRATVTLLRAMAGRPDFRAFEEALPLLGRDGTLADAVAPDSPARGHVRAKTGTYWVENALTGRAVLTSKALAGILETATGRRLVFAFFVNEVVLDAPEDRVTDATEAAGRLLGRLCEVFYDDSGSRGEAGRTSVDEPAQTTPEP